MKYEKAMAETITFEGGDLLCKRSGNHQGGGSGKGSHDKSYDKKKIYRTEPDEY